MSATKNVGIHTRFLIAWFQFQTHRHELDVLADALLKYETLDADDVQAIVDGNWTRRSSAKDQKARKAAFDLAR